MQQDMKTSLQGEPNRNLSLKLQELFEAIAADVVPSLHASQQYCKRKRKLAITGFCFHFYSWMHQCTREELLFSNFSNG